MEARRCIAVQTLDRVAIVWREPAGGRAADGWRCQAFCTFGTNLKLLCGWWHCSQNLEILAIVRRELQTAGLLPSVRIALDPALAGMPAEPQLKAAVPRLGAELASGPGSSSCRLPSTAAQDC